MMTREEAEKKLDLVRWRLKHSDFEFPKTGRAKAEREEKELLTVINRL